MDSKKYIGMDVHKESISIAVMNGAGKIGMECVIEMKASTILQFIDGLRGDLQVTFEEGTSAAWLYDLLKPHVTKLVVGPIRAAVLLGILQTPHRFRTKRQLWSYSGVGIETHSSADYRSVDGRLQHAGSAKAQTVRRQRKPVTSGTPFTVGCTQSLCCIDARFKVTGLVFEDHAA